MYKPLNEVPLEFDKYTKLGHGGDDARQPIAYPVLQKITFQPAIHLSLFHQTPLGKKLRADLILFIL